MEYSYRTKNVCPRIIKFNLDGNIVTNVRFIDGGCPGNLQAVPRLVEGMTVSEIESKLGDIICGMRGTSCVSELTKAVKEAYEKSIQHI